MLKETAQKNIKILTLAVQLHLSETEVPGDEELFFLPDSAQANLTDMGKIADQEVAMSQQDKEIAT